MVFPWRRTLIKNNNNNLQERMRPEIEIMIPTHFRCPISLDLMKDPVTLPTGITYDRESIEKWIEEGNITCPVTNQAMMSHDQIPNHSIRRMIQDWCVENKSYGIKRIPTPRIPITPYEVSETCKKFLLFTKRADQSKCRELVTKLRNWAKESERNKKCIEENGAGYVLSNCFESFSGLSVSEHEGLLKEILSVLVWLFPKGIEGQEKLASTKSLSSLVWFLRSNEDLGARQDSVSILKELLASDQIQVIALTEIDGIFEALVKLIKEPICPTATKASLIAILHMISRSDTIERIVSTFVEMGLVSLMIEIVVDGDKSICENALSVLDNICDTKQGRETAYGHALLVPLLIKKILKLSHLASEISVSILWKLCKNEGWVDVVVEAIQLGAFQKLLVLLQVGCGENTKEKVSDLLKLFNLYRSKLDCVDPSMDFKFLKKSY